MKTYVIEPAILYFGTPVVLVSTLIPDGQTANLAPISSAWWLGYGCMLGLTGSAHTAANLARTGECVLNLPSVAQAPAVDRLARTTGAHPVPPDKAWLGFEHEADKWARSGLTAVESDLVGAPRARQCPVQLEAVVEEIRPFGANNPLVPTAVVAVELRVVRVHAHETILSDPAASRVDPDAWNPLLMSFRKFYGLSRQVHGSRLSEGADDGWRPAPLGAMPLPPPTRVTAA